MTVDSEELRFCKWGALLANGKPPFLREKLTYVYIGMNIMYTGQEL